MPTYTIHNWKSLEELIREVLANPNATPMELELVKRIEAKKKGKY